MLEFLYNLPQILQTIIAVLIVSLTGAVVVCIAALPFMIFFTWIGKCNT
jgi:hypothetical protein